MRTLHNLLSAAILATLIALSSSAPQPAAAQGAPPWLQVWYFPQEQDQPALIEYRDMGGNVVASYALASDAMHSPRQASGYVLGWDIESIPVFNPYTGLVTHIAPPALPESTDTSFVNLSGGFPGPNGTIAYAIAQVSSGTDTPARNRVFVATVGQSDDRLVHETDSPSPWSAVQPVGWSRDGSALLLHDMPQGIGGYILFWTWQNVRALNLATGALIPLGDADGYAADLAYVALLQTNDSGPTGLHVTNTATGQVMTYPLPPLPEAVSVGGGAVFSPDNTKVAYQVARNNPEAEKFYTIVTDLASGQSRVVLEDEAPNYEVRYGNVAGWLDENTLVVGGPWTDRSLAIDARSGAQLREEFGAFLGYAEGITNAGDFARGGIAYTQCPGAPPSRLAANMRGRITFTSGAMTNVRYWAGLDADLAGQMAEGATFTALYGPACADGYAWWNVQFDSGLEGYIAEGTPSEYWLEPWQ